MAINKRYGSLIINFFSFGITFIPQSHNVFTDTLANTASIFTPSNNRFIVEMFFRHFIPENVTNWRVLNDNS
jgi:hypothetical protein